MSENLKKMLTSKRFWAAAAGVVVVAGKDLLGLNLSEEQVTAIAAVVVAWIVGDSIRETGTTKS